MTAAFTPRRMGLAPPQRRVAAGAVAPSQSARLGHYVPSNPFLAVGMAEVSSTEALVEVGKHYKKGDPLGCFHYGGSTHCLIFRPETELEFFNDVSMGTETSLRPGTWYNTPVNIDATNVPVRAQIAKASAKDL